MGETTADGEDGHAEKAEEPSFLAAVEVCEAAEEEQEAALQRHNKHV